MPPAFRTRGATKRAAEAEAEASRICFTDLPEELLLNIFEHLPLRSVVRLGSLTRVLHQISLTGSLWTRIDFGEVSVAVCASMTDDKLDKLLRRVDAHTHLAHLSLLNCFQMCALPHARGAHPCVRRMR